MNYIQLTKIAAAIVITLLILISINKLTNSLYISKIPKKSEFKITLNNKKYNKINQKKETPTVDLKTLLTSASILKGKETSRKCISCHTFNKNGKNRTGPNLFGILNRKIANKENYKYSKALMIFNKNEKQWTYNELFNFIKKPKKFAKGTTMNFIGIKNDNQRANLIIYLRSLSDNPINLP